MIAEVHLELLVSKAWSSYAGSAQVFARQFVGIPAELLEDWRAEINANPPQFLTRGSKGTASIPSVEFQGIDEERSQEFLGDFEGPINPTTDGDEFGSIVVSRVRVTIKALSATQTRTLYILARAILLANKRALMQDAGYLDLVFVSGGALAGATDTEAEGRGTTERAFVVEATHVLAFTPASDSDTEYPWAVQPTAYET